MKCFVLCCVIASIFLFHFGDAAVSILPNAVNPNFPNKCYYDTRVKVPLILKPGSHADIQERCERAYCHSDFSMSFTGCGVIGTSPGCTPTPMDTTKDYPDCCPSVKCP